jgi:hypothetical protein
MTQNSETPSASFDDLCALAVNSTISGVGPLSVTFRHQKWRICSAAGTDPKDKRNVNPRGPHLGPIYCGDRPQRYPLQYGHS